VLLGLAITEAVIIVGKAVPDSYGVDFHAYQVHVARFLAGGSLFESWQLAGPYEIHAAFAGEVAPANVFPSLYPPLIIPLVAPFLVLPEILWWAIPIGLVLYTIWRLRPAPWSWPVMAALLVYPRTADIVLSGNPAMWVVAAVGAAAVWHWPGVLVLLKPSLFPFALIGIRSRSWWLAAGILAIASLGFLSAWLEWLVVLQNVRGSTVLYNLRDAPSVAIPVVAFVGSRRFRGAISRAFHAG